MSIPLSILNPNPNLNLLSRAPIPNHQSLIPIPNIITNPKSQYLLPNINFLIPIQNHDSNHHKTNYVWLWHNIDLAYLAYFFEEHKGTSVTSAGDFQSKFINLIAYWLAWNVRGVVNICGSEIRSFYWRIPVAYM